MHGSPFTHWVANLASRSLGLPFVALTFRQPLVYFMAPKCERNDPDSLGVAKRRQKALTVSESVNSPLVREEEPHVGTKLYPKNDLCCHISNHQSYSHRTQPLSVHTGKSTQHGKGSVLPTAPLTPRMLECKSVCNWSSTEIIVFVSRMSLSILQLVNLDN